MNLFIRLLVNAAALWCAAYFIDGITYSGTGIGLLALALVFGVVNTLIRPVLSFFSFPIQIVTLGIFTLVLNALMLMLTSYLARRFDIPFAVSGFVPAFLGALLVSVLSTILSWVFVKEDDDD